MLGYKVRISDFLTKKSFKKTYLYIIYKRVFAWWEMLYLLSEEEELPNDALIHLWQHISVLLQGQYKVNHVFGYKCGVLYK